MNIYEDMARDAGAMGDEIQQLAEIIEADFRAQFKEAPHGYCHQCERPLTRIEGRDANHRHDTAPETKDEAIAWKEAYLTLLSDNWTDNSEPYEAAKARLVELGLVRIGHAGKIYPA